MPTEETTAPEALHPVPESQNPAPATEPEISPKETQPATAPDSTSSPQAETGPQGPLPFSTAADRQENQVAQPSTPTAQIPPNEPLPPEPSPSHEATEGQSEPFDSAPDSAKATSGAQDKPITPEPPSAAASTPSPAHPIRDFLTRARIATQDRKRKKRDKIMLALTTKNKITNDEVEKLLHVSDATATRYLSALEREGKIRQVGKTGMGVSYSKVQ